MYAFQLSGYAMWNITIVRGGDSDIELKDVDFGSKLLTIIIIK